MPVVLTDNGLTHHLIIKFIPMIRFVCGFVLFFTMAPSHSQDLDSLRVQMVQNQLVRKNIKDTLTLRAMAAVPRHEFVRPDIQAKAYDDGILPIGDGQTIYRPYIIAYMTQELQLRKTFKVLEVGTGSGYHTAVIAQAVDSVFSIEINERLALEAESTLERLGYENIKIKTGDGYYGWPEKGPFDAILVSASIDTIPPPLMEQLNEGGRMIIPVGKKNELQYLVLAKKVNGKVMIKNRIRARFSPLVRKEN